MIIFESVEAKKFLSIGENGIKINFTKGLNVISGINKDKSGRSNGTGKSSIMESIYFALFGNTIREVKKKNDVIHWRYKKGCKVTLKLSKGKTKYIIIREAGSSALTLKKNGKDVTRDSIENTQKDIDDILGCSEDVIKNCVIMGINQTVPFMKQGKAQKRQFIEGIFDMSVFFEMLKAVRKDYNEEVKEMTSLEAKIQEQESSLKVYKEQSERFDENKQERIFDLQEEINDLEGKMQDLNLSKHDEGKLKPQIKVLVDEIEEYEVKLDKYDDQLSGKIADKQRDYNRKMDKCSVEINSIQKQIDNAFKSGTCPTCKREMTDADTKHVETEIQALTDKITVLKSEKDVASKSLDKVDAMKEKIRKQIRKITEEKREKMDALDDIEKKLRENEVKSDKIKDINEQIDKCFKKIDKVKKENNEIKDKYEEQRTKLDSNREDYDKISKNVDVLDKLKFIFGENGVKSYIINKMLDILNKRVNYYLDRLNANCTLEFDEFFDDTIINEKNQECTYFNLSSGERRNVDLAVMFAFMDLQKAQGKFECNLMCFDELIDGSLDEEGVGLIMDILKDKAESDKCVYLITHRKESGSYATGSVINVVKENGITKIAA